MTVDLGYLDTPIYDMMKREEKFRSDIQSAIKFAEYDPPVGAYTRGWDFAVSMLADALEHGNYEGALAVPDTVKSEDSKFCSGYEAAMRGIKGEDYA